MRAGGGKKKGSEFERLICKKLSLWVSQGANDDLFWRSAMSGGRASVQYKKGIANRQAGDITAVSPEGHEFTDWFYVECKSVRDLNIQAFMFQTGVGKLKTFWSAAKRQAVRHNRWPMIICKENRSPVLVVMQHFDTPYWLKNVRHWGCAKKNVCVFLLDDMLAAHFKGRP